MQPGNTTRYSQSCDYPCQQRLLGGRNLAYHTKEELSAVEWISVSTLCSNILKVNVDSLDADTYVMYYTGK